MWFCAFMICLLAEEMHSSASGHDYNTPQDELREEYDFIIVGGGPAGSRLFEKLTNASRIGAEYNVLLIEAGGNPPLWTEVPLFYSYIGSPGYDKELWKFPFERNGQYSMAHKVPIVPAGKVLGGGSTINGAGYQRGCAADYDRIKEETGCDGWGYKEVLEAFKHDEKNLDESINKNGHHGTKGTLCIDSPVLGNGETRGYEAWKEALNQIGMEYGDLHDGSCHGKGYHFQAAYCHGIRYSAVTSFILPFYIARRNQMHIKLNTLVTKLVIDKSHLVPRVVGVETADSITGLSGPTFRARKEVILTAGAIKSPQILMLSGIGPAEHLESRGITPVVDLPGVGRNLHNHPGMLLYVTNVPATFIPNKTCEDMDAYFKGPSGSLLSSTVDMVGVAYHQLGQDVLPRPADDDTLKYDLSDVEFTFLGKKGFPEPVGSVEESVQKEYLDPLKKENYLMVYVFQTHQKSRGFVELNSTDPFAQPYMFFNYFSDKSDLETLAMGAMKMAEILQSSPFANLGIKLYDKKIPQCKQHSFPSVDYFRCHVKYLTVENVHYGGTTQMGCNQRTNPNAVVNANCKVYGINGLRVADVGISHELPQGHSMAYAYLSGALCGDRIIDAYSAQHSSPNRN